MQRTGLQGAINLAVHLGGGGSRVVLIGADMGPAPDGRTHHHRPHPWPQKPDCWELQMAQLRETAPILDRLGVEVVNASPTSRIEWWRKAALADIIRETRNE